MGRAFLAVPALVALSILVFDSPAAAQPHPANVIMIDASKSASARPILNPLLGGKSPAGHDIEVNSGRRTRPDAEGLFRIRMSPE